jgi:hypothetical protein
MKKRILARTIFLFLLFVLAPVQAAADCAIVTREQLSSYLPEVATSAYLSGSLLGGSLVLSCSALRHYVYRTQSYLVPALTSFFFLTIACGLFLIDVTVGSECGFHFGATGYLPNLSLFLITL